MDHEPIIRSYYSVSDDEPIEKKDDSKEEVIEGEKPKEESDEDIHAFKVGLVTIITILVIGFIIISWVLVNNSQKSNHVSNTTTNISQ
jgi:hypothetical protein